MNPNTKACIAYIAARIISGISIKSINDKNQQKVIKIDGSVSENETKIYDHDRGCNVQGPLSDLFDHGTNSHIELEITSNKFSGRDLSSGAPFTGSVNGNEVLLNAGCACSYSF